jgi:putative PIG3 family NAD(P)H quinone oxidoreductase
LVNRTVQNRTMRAVTLPRFGDASVLTIAEVAEPSVGTNDVLINVVGAGLNRADLSQRQGNYPPPPPGAPAWPGMEVSGVVEAIGAAVTEFAVGDRVCALVPGGGYAELVAVDAGLVLPAPVGTPLLDAAGLPEAVATVWANIFMSANLQPSESLLVHGGSSGIGSMAIQIATALGSRVIATAGSSRKTEFIGSLGATPVNYMTEDFVESALDFTEGLGVDVVLDLVGGDYIARDIEALAMNGRIMCIANQSGQPSNININALMRRRGRIWATTLRARPLAHRVAIIASMKASVWPLIESHRVRPIIDRVFAPEEAGDAHRYLEDGRHMGKILLQFSSSS